ncbi:hypothetical protein [Pedobacter nyackensis]|uniref:hypothetical protein n=1 Tax=Pedobacter nyackensis TaxID=475255 RepID=UPI00292CBABB|nr:hypothetical protein [Pedobacter nyackensis]
MNNIKKGAIGVLAAVLALGAGLYSIKTQSVFTYYKTDMTYPSPNDPRGYKYYSEDMCLPGGTLCTANWELGSNPAPSTDGQSLPTTGVTFQSGTVTSGHFE